MQLYPQARVLAASSQDIAGEKRRLFVARAATNDWDGVIMTRSAFERIPVSIVADIAYRERQLSKLRAVLEQAKGGSGLTVKRLEKTVARDAEKLKRLRDADRDPGVTFEETGFDYVIIDFTSRPFRVRLVRFRGCGAGWRTRGQGLCAEASTSFDRAWGPREFSVRRRSEPEGEWSWLSENSRVPARWAGSGSSGPG